MSRSEKPLPSPVAAAARLPSNAEYLAHLGATSADRRLIRLASNESTDPPSPRVRDALLRSYDDANLSPPTVPPLRRALAERRGINVARVLVGAGSTELIDALLRAYVGPGDEVVLPVPSWPVYARRLAALDARVVEVPLHRDERSFAFDVDAIANAVTPATRLVVVCTPNNPTGNAMPREDIERCARAAPLLLLDAAYADFADEAEVERVVSAHANVVLARTFSKAYSLAGLRVGYLIGDEGVLDVVDRFLVPGTSVSSASLHAALAALEDEEYRRRRVEGVVAERERVVAAVRELGLRVFDSRASFYALDVPDPTGLASALLDAGIVVRVLGPLVRITVGRPDENDAVLAALSRLRARSPRAGARSPR